MPFLRPLTLVAALACLLPTAGAKYLFTYFTKNGEDGLHLAWSSDGYTWERLNQGKSYLTPKVGKSRLMRDPCVVRAPDGTFHLVWTSGWNENNIGYASTKDFLSWSAQKEIPVMAHESKVRNCWAPEIAYDEAREEFILFWASTIPGRFPETAGASESAYNYRMYFTTTKDFAAFAPTKLFYDPGFSVIDATFLHADGRHYLILKDETVNPPKKHLRIASADDLRGPFGALSAPFTPAGLWVEGPTVAKVGGYHVVYFDAYKTGRYGVMRSRDLKTWEDITTKLKLPDEHTSVRMRHGTVIEVASEIVARLRSAGE
ncbi:MAG: glycoside hydrolase family 43 protein [Opitutaceae bacterium]|nr:glycoside hydrolase family 43 protein [Opitutaceae bacterium]